MFYIVRFLFSKVYALILSGYKMLEKFGVNFSDYLTFTSAGTNLLTRYLFYNSDGVVLLIKISGYE